MKAKMRILSSLIFFTIGLTATRLSHAEIPLRKAPELAFRTANGQEQLLSSYRGKVVSLEFIHTTCVHCQQASQVQKRLQQTYSEEGFQAIDVAINPNADLLIGNFVKDFQLNFPVGWTTREQALTFLSFSTTKLYVIPQIVVIDRNGYIHAETTPMGEDPVLDSIRGEEALTSLVKRLLSNKGAASRAPHPRAMARK